MIKIGKLMICNSDYSNATQFANPTNNALNGVDSEQEIRTTHLIAMIHYN